MRLCPGALGMGPGFFSSQMTGGGERWWRLVFDSLVPDYPPVLSSPLLSPAKYTALKELVKKKGKRTKERRRGYKKKQQKKPENPTRTRGEVRV